MGLVRRLRDKTLALGLAAAVVGVTVAVAPSASYAKTTSSTLYAGHSLSAGHQIVSTSGHYRAVMKTGGNFVVYGPGNTVQWQSKTAGTGGTRITMQTDGNLVIYTAGGKAVWSSATAPSTSDDLVMQNDGNLVIYSAGGLPLWASRGGRTGYSEDTLHAGQSLSVGQELVSQSQAYRAIMQGDGNFVVYGPGGATWSSQTAGSGGNEIIMQNDGNLVIYAPGGKAVYSSATAPSSGDALVMQNDGNLVIYSGGVALWAKGQPLGANPGAVAWAQAHLGEVYGTASEQPASYHQWSGYCWTFVFDAFGSKAPREATAQDAFNYYNSRGMVHTTGTPPAGSIAFYSYLSDGHAAVVVSGGQIIGTKGTDTDRYPVYQTAYNNRGLPFEGWVLP